MSTRRPVKFESMNGSISYTFPRYELDYDSSQAIELSYVVLTGADYEFDMLGDSEAPRRNGQQNLRFLLVGQPAAIEAELDAMRAKLYTGARGWFYTADDDGTQRRCVARVLAMPQMSLGVRDRQRMPVILGFVQNSDFYNVASIDEHDGAVQIVSGDPGEVIVNNPGNATVRNAIITIKGPFDGLSIENESALIAGTVSPYTFATARVAADNTEWLRINASANTVEFSDDSGGTWNDDSDEVVLGNAGQVGLMVIAPGVNTFNIAGADTAEIEFAFAGAWL